MFKKVVSENNFDLVAQDEENMGNVKRQLAKLFEGSLRAVVPDEQDVEAMVAASTGKFGGDYQW